MADPVSPQYRACMNRLANQIDKALNGRRKPGKQPTVGFVLLISEFGKIDNGRVNYISNGERASMVAMLREYLARVEGRYVEPDSSERPQ